MYTADMSREELVDRIAELEDLATRPAGLRERLREGYLRSEGDEQLAWDLDDCRQALAEHARLVAMDAADALTASLKHPRGIK